MILTGKHAVVTGGGRGIGAAIAQALSDAGATVTLMGRNLATVEKAAGELSHANAIGVDVTDPNSVNAAFDQAAKLAPINILVNNAGAAETAPFNRTDEAMWRRMFAVNVDGAYRCIQAVLPAMQEQGGRIVNIASTAALKGYPYTAAYCASKHALLGLTRALAQEFAKNSITINAVCPGYTESELLENSVGRIVEATGRSPEDARKILLRENTQGRFIQPVEVATAVLWLCGPGAESVTGQAIPVCGAEVVG